MQPQHHPRPMTSREVQEMLQRHSDALASGQDIAPELIEQNPQSGPKLRPLLGLNRQLSESLQPVEPSRSFVSSLRQRLGDAYAVAHQEQDRHAQQMRAHIGTGVGALVVIGLLVRLIGSIIMVSAFVARTRRHDEALKSSS